MPRRTALLVAVLSAGGLWYAAPSRLTDGVSRIKSFITRVAPASSAEASSRTRTEPPADSLAPLPVTTAVAVSRVAALTRTSVGSIEATARVAVRARIDGAIIERHVQDGASVEAGDLLFRLDDRELQAQIARSEAALAVDRALLAKAQSELRRTQELLARSVATQAKADEAAADVKIAAANVAASEAALEIERTKLAHTRITAPIGGRVGVVHVSEGSLVRGSDLSGDGLVTITRMSPLQVAFALPERDLPSLRAALIGPSQFRAVRILSDQRDHPPANAELSFIDSSVDTSSGTIPAKAVLRDTNDFWPGQYVRVELTLGAQPSAVAVPLEAVKTTSEGTYVFVMAADQRVEKRLVDALGTQGGDVLIGRGLSSGERVVIEAHPRLRHGSLVAEASPRVDPRAGLARTADAGAAYQ